jgi:hypothetical protein
MKVNRKTSTLLFASCFALSLTVTVLLTRHSERSSVTNSKLLTTRDVHGLSLGETVSVPTFETFNGPAQSVTDPAATHF